MVVQWSPVFFRKQGKGPPSGSSKMWRVLTKDTSVFYRALGIYTKLNTGISCLDSGDLQICVVANRIGDFHLVPPGVQIISSLKGDIYATTNPLQKHLHGLSSCFKGDRSSHRS